MRALDPAAAAAILDALQQKAIFSLAEKVGVPLRMVTRNLAASERGMSLKKMNLEKQEAESKAEAGVLPSSIQPSIQRSVQPSIQRSVQLTVQPSIYPTVRAFNLRWLLTAV